MRRHGIARRLLSFVPCRRWAASPPIRPAPLWAGIRIRPPTLPILGRLPATSPHAIRTGSWLAREALTNARGLKRYAAASCAIAAAMSLAAAAARPTHPHLPYPHLEWPLQISGSQYAPVP